MNFKQLFIIIRREFLNRVRKKSFLWITLLSPILTAGFLAFAIYLGISGSPNYNVLIHAENQDMLDYLQSAKLANNEKLKIKFFYSTEFVAIDTLKNSPYNVEMSIDPELLLNAQSTPNRSAVVVPLYFTEKISAFAESYIRTELEAKFERLKVQYFELRKNGESMHLEDFDQLKVKLQFDPIEAQSGEHEQVKKERLWVGLFLSFLIYLFIFMYGTHVMRGVLEEKTNRIVELIISSVEPFTLMLGKILGIALVALTQFALWLGLSGGLYFLFQYLLIPSVSEIALQQMQVLDAPQMTTALAQQVSQNGLNWQSILAENRTLDLIFNRFNYGLVLAVFLFYFLGGYLLYAAIFAAIAAAVDAEADTQQFVVPVSMPLIFALLLAQFSLYNTDSFASVFASIFPLTSPVVMMMRIQSGIDSTQLWQLWLSMFSLVVAFLFATWGAAKIYRRGILQYGTKISWKTLFSWLRT